MRKPFLVILLTYTIAMIGFLIIPGIDPSGNVYHMTIFDAFYFISYGFIVLVLYLLYYKINYFYKKLKKQNF